MPRIGIRELRDKLSSCLAQVREGKRFEITNRGEVVALLIPVKEKKASEELLALVGEGTATWSGGKPTGAPRPVKGRGRPVSELIVEDRR